MFFKIGVLKNFAIFTEKHLGWPLQAVWQNTYGGCFWIFAAANTFFSWIWYLLLTVTPIFAPNSTKTPPLKTSFWKFCKFHRKAAVLKSLFNRVVDLKACSLIKNRLQHGCFPVEFTKFLRTTNLKSANTSFWNLFFHLDFPF